jgi:hypothetical protein
MAWELVETTQNDDEWSVTDRLKIGDGYLVRTVWRHRVGGERLDGAVAVVTGAFDLPAPQFAIEGPKSDAVAT